MKKIDIYEDFYFNGRNLSSFGGRIIQDDSFIINSLLPQKEILSEKILGVDGEIVYGSTLSPRTFDVLVYFDNLTDVRTISAWLHTTEPVDFYYIGDTVKIKSMISDMVDYEVYYDGFYNSKDNYKGIMQLKFIAHDPLYYLINDKTFTYTTFTSTHTFNCEGSYKSFPTIKFETTSTQNIVYEINGVQSEIKSINGWCLVDGLYRTVDSPAGNKRSSFTGTFPVLNPTTNTFRLVSGSVSRVTIQTRTRLL